MLPIPRDNGNQLAEQMMCDRIRFYFQTVNMFAIFFVLNLHLLLCIQTKRNG